MKKLLFILVFTLTFAAPVAASEWVFNHVPAILDAPEIPAETYAPEVPENFEEANSAYYNGAHAYSEAPIAFHLEEGIYFDGLYFHSHPNLVFAPYDTTPYDTDVHIEIETEYHYHYYFYGDDDDDDSEVRGARTETTELK